MEVRIPVKRKRAKEKGAHPQNSSTLLKATTGRTLSIQPPCAPGAGVDGAEPYITRRAPSAWDARKQTEALRTHRRGARDGELRKVFGLVRLVPERPGRVERVLV